MIGTWACSPANRSDWRCGCSRTSTTTRACAVPSAGSRHPSRLSSMAAGRWRSLGRSMAWSDMNAVSRRRLRTKSHAITFSARHFSRVDGKRPVSASTTVPREIAASIAYLRQRGIRLWNLDDLGIFASLAEWTGRDADPCLELEFAATAVGEGDAGAGMHPRRNRTRNAPFATKWGRRV